MIRIIQIPVLTDNYQYLLICETTRQAVSVDAADAEALVAALEREAVTLTAVWNTHHHWDHVGANEELAARYKVPVYCGQYDFAQGRVPNATHGLREGDEVHVGQLRFRVLEIPGHTLGHIAYFGHGVVICGDTLFVGGCGRLFEGTPAMMLASLNKLKTLPSETRVYCMHEYTLKNLLFAQSLEPDNEALRTKLREVSHRRVQGRSTVPSTLGEELGYNPFLRVQSAELRESLRQKGVAFANDDVDVLRAVRELKDRF